MATDEHQISVFAGAKPLDDRRFSGTLRVRRPDMQEFAVRWIEMNDSLEWFHQEVAVQLDGGGNLRLVLGIDPGCFSYKRTPANPLSDAPLQRISRADTNTLACFQPSVDQLLELTTRSLMLGLDSVNESRQYAPKAALQTPIYREPVRAEHGLSSLAASELLDGVGTPHVDVRIWDIEDARRFFESPRLKRLRSLSLSRLDIDDEALLSLPKSKLARLQWLDLSHNPRITRDGVETLCDAVHARALNPLWVDLAGTSCDATPYVDGGDLYTAEWRVPSITHELAQSWGAQRWMSAGLDLAREGAQRVRIDEFPPNRFNPEPPGTE